MTGLRVTLQTKKMEWLILYSFLSNVAAAKVCPDSMRFDEVNLILGVQETFRNFMLCNIRRKAFERSPITQKEILL